MLAAHPDNPLLGENHVIAYGIHRAMRPVIISSVIAHKRRQRADIKVPPRTHVGKQHRVIAARHDIGS
ncbi:hypothetical protein D3C75_1165530 [compost metagenome]